MLKIPAKYKRCGLKVKCLHCKYQVSFKCGKTGKSISSCEHIEQHRYNLIVCVPRSPGARRTKILDTKNFEEALVELAKFKAEQKQIGYHKLKIKKVSTETSLSYFITEYLNVCSGNGLAILVRKRSKEHINDSLRAFARFRDALTNSGYNFRTIDAKDIGDVEVNIFHEYLLNELKFGQRNYNKHMGILKTLYFWISRVKNYSVQNPFTHVELHTVKKEVTIITKSQFEKFIGAITKENSYDSGSKKYLFREWLVPAYKLALQTGLRREELLNLTWADLVPIDDNKLVCRITNLKVNRIMSGRSNTSHMKYIPVTRGLMTLLLELGYNEKKNSKDIIIERGVDQSMIQAKDLLSRGFSHFIKLTTDTKLEFGVLRKTYITKLSLAAGPNAKMFTGHTNDDVLKNHYLSQAFVAANLDDFSVF